MAWAIVGTSRLLLINDCRPTKTAPCGKWGATVLAASSARRVLPLPPRPVTVSSRHSGSRRRTVTSVSSCVRPTKGVRYPTEEWLTTIVLGDPHVLRVPGNEHQLHAKSIA